MTCRDEVIAAFNDLQRETDHIDFTPTEILRRMRAAGSIYKDSTIKTHVTAHMVDSGALVRVSLGRYRLSRHRHQPIEPTPPSLTEPGDRITEDEVKRTVKAHLEAEGWTVRVAWARERGIDIEATRAGERLLLEAKGEAPAGPQQVNYFLGAIGELVQRMADSEARYGLALPDHRQYRGLVSRLPALARKRLHLVVYFVGRRDGQLIVTSSS